MTLDFVAKRYGQLPSKVLESGSSLDAKCAILAQGYENYLHEKAKAEANGQAMPPAKSKQQDLQEMIKAVRENNARKNEAKNSSGGESSNTQTT